MPPRNSESPAGGRGASENRFAISWINPPEEGVAPIVAVDYELCRVEQPSHCVSGRREGLGIERIDDIGVPGNGAWRLRVVLTDEAGT